MNSGYFWKVVDSLNWCGKLLVPALLRVRGDSLSVCRLRRTDRKILRAIWLFQTGVAFQKKDQMKQSLQLLGIIMAVSDPSPTMACNSYWLCFSTWWERHEFLSAVFWTGDCGECNLPQQIVGYMSIYKYIHKKKKNLVWQDSGIQSSDRCFYLCLGT